MSSATGSASTAVLDVGAAAALDVPEAVLIGAGTGLLFILPGAVVMLALSVLFVVAGGVPAVAAVFFFNGSLFGALASRIPAIKAANGLSEATLGLGSYGTRRASAAWQSGWLDNGLALYGRASFNDSDGYRERSGVRQNTFFISAAYLGERSELKLTSFSGRERTQLSFLAVDPDRVRRFEAPRPNALWQTDLFTFLTVQRTRTALRLTIPHRTMLIDQTIQRACTDPRSRSRLINRRAISQRQQSPTRHQQRNPRRSHNPPPSVTPSRPPPETKQGCRRCMWRPEPAVRESSI